MQLCSIQLCHMCYVHPRVQQVDVFYVSWIHQPALVPVLVARAPNLSLKPKLLRVTFQIICVSAFPFFSALIIFVSSSGAFLLRVCACDPSGSFLLVRVSSIPCGVMGSVLSLGCMWAGQLMAGLPKDQTATLKIKGSGKPWRTKRLWFKATNCTTASLYHSCCPSHWCSRDLGIHFNRQQQHKYKVNKVGYWEKIVTVKVCVSVWGGGASLHLHVGFFKLLSTTIIISYITSNKIIRQQM